MGELLAPAHLIVLAFVGLCFFLLPAIFFILTLQKALNKCAPQSRTMEPGLVWLYIIPFVNLIFAFFLVLAMANSLRNEFNRRGILVGDPAPGQGIGIAMAVCACCTFVPILGLLSGIAHLVLWIVYWVKIAEYSRALDVQPQMMPPVNAF